MPLLFFNVPILTSPIANSMFNAIGFFISINKFPLLFPLQRNH